MNEGYGDEDNHGQSPCSKPNQIPKGVVDTGERWRLSEGEGIE